MSQKWSTDILRYANDIIIDKEKKVEQRRHYNIKKWKKINILHPQ